MAFVLPPLPWAQDALQPHISKETVEFHYGKHHAGYVTKLNEITANTDLAKKSLEDLIKTQSGKVFNLAAQIWNHTFYWNGMKANGGGQPSGRLADAINRDFGSFDKFKQQFTDTAVNHFGSGWAWLSQDPASGTLAITEGHDAQNPMTLGRIPIVTCDVWEHAYYIDKRNNRAGYVAAWWNLVNWEFAEAQLKKRPSNL
jgi:Fe-Mn family superoxide dismutase